MLRVYRRRGRHPSFPLVALGFLAVALAGGAAFNATTAHGSAEVQATAADSVVLFGPVEFTSDSTQGQQYYVETFADPVAQNTASLAILSDETVSTSAFTVVLNGDTLTTTPDCTGLGCVGAQLPQIFPEDSILQAGVAYRAVGSFESVNTLEVEFDGSATFELSISAYRSALDTAEVVVYGPETFMRSGSPTTVADSFALPAGLGPPFRLLVDNGAPDGSARASSGNLWLNGDEVVSSGDFGQGVSGIARTITLLADNELEVQVQAPPGAQITVRATASDTAPPVLTVTSPADSAVIGADSVQVAGTVSDATPVVVKANGHSAAVDSLGDWSVWIPLSVEGPNDILVEATDLAGLSSSESLTVIRSTLPPELVVTDPDSGLVTSADSVTVAGTTTGAVSVNVNGIPLSLMAGAFTGQIALTEGPNNLVITAESAGGSQTSEVRVVIRDTQPPALTVTAPLDGSSTEDDSVMVAGTVTDATEVAVTANGVPMLVQGDDTFSGSVGLAEGPNTILVLATDEAGNESSESRSVTRTTDPGELPPDPATVAPPIDPTVPTTMMAATEFLYTGADPIQTGVVPGTIALERTAALRGQVLDITGSALPGVTVSVKNHPEFGQTLSRTDGAYDLVVNGGGPLTIEYEKSGYMGVDRTVDVPWQDWVVLEDVALLQPDTAVTTITLTDPIEVARGTPQTDADGTRQATVLFAGGTQAQMRMPDGSTQPLSSLNVRLTEATVGQTGPMAMPAELPPTSAYTYAVELRVDQAEAAGATGVEFDQPVPFYVENFTGFPVGLTVPVGRYDEQAAAWMPEPNGRIIEVVGINGGLAEIDTDGDGSANAQASLDSLGITANEQQELATLYTVGTSLWRAPIDHFSWIDLNWPFGKVDIPPGEDPRQDRGEDCASEVAGSIIECENQVLGERFPVTGTDLSLNYRSGRMPGDRTNYTLEIPITGDSIPPDVRRAIVEVQIAGRTFTDTVESPGSNESLTFEWDGIDAYGRPLPGAPVVVTSSFVYGFQYFAAPEDAEAFGLNCRPNQLTDFGVVCTIPNTLSLPVRLEDSIARRWQGFLGTVTTENAGLGGWTPSAYHAYDPLKRVLYRGDGGRRTVDNNDVVRTMAGSGFCSSPPDSGEGGPATDATICDVAGVGVAPDGSFFVADRFLNVVRKVDPDGVITTFAGTGSPGYSGDGGPAIDAEIRNPQDADLGPDGSLYIADSGNPVVRRVAPDGTITTVAGTGTPGFSGDGGPATQADFSYVDAVAVADDGTLFILDSGNARIRRVDPDGIVQTIAGTGVFGFNGDSVPANLAQMNPFVGDIEVADDGSVYLADTDNHLVRRIDPSGLMTTVAGTGNGGSTPVDGIQATESVVDNPTGLALGPEGNIYITEWFNHRLRRVHPNGVITTIAGGNADCVIFGVAPLVEDAPGTAAPLCYPEDVEIGPDGGLYIADVEHHRIRRLGPFMEGVRPGDQVIASRDGSEAYIFSALRHLETRSTLNGALLYAFAHDSTGRLETITDADGLVTTIQRDAAGEPTAIIAPFGQQTDLAVDSAGWLSSIANPAGEAIALAHDSLGLLESIEDARGFEYTFVYDSLGRLERDDDPAGGFQTLVRIESAGEGTGHSVRRTTALGRTWEYGTERLPTAEKERTLIGADGLETNRFILRSGKTTVEPPDSTTIEMVLRPDPRFGMQAPQLDTLRVTTPAGRQLQVTTASHVTVTDPQNPLMLNARVDTLTVNGRVWESTYDGTTREVTVTSPMGRQYTQQLDSLNRVTQVSVPGLNDLDIAYDSAGLVSSATTSSRTWQYRYDALGRLRAIEDPQARADSFVFDAGNRLTRTIFANGDSVGFAYDSSGNLTGLTPPGRPEHRFSYSPIDLLGSYVAPGADTTAYGNTLDRELGTVIRPGGDTIAVSYDTAGRPEMLSIDGGQIGFSYDGQTGQLSGLTGPYGGGLTFDYDGILLTDVTWSGSVSGSFSVTYDDDFRVTESRVNGANPISFGYDLDGLLTSAGALTIDRDSANGFVTGSALGSVTTNRGYNGFGEMVSFGAGYSGSGLFETSYVRDVLGRIDTLTQVIQSDTTALVYGYDEIGRLEEVETNGVVTATYTYDTNGNRLQVVGPGGSVSGTYDDRDRLVSYGSATYSYAPAGELAAKVVGSDTTRYAYDALGNLTSVELPDGTTIGYDADAAGRRIRRLVDGVPQRGFLYRDQLNPVAELNGTGQVVSRFVYGDRINVPEYLIRGGTIYRIVTDHLGSVRLVVDVATGSVAQRIDYDEFGVVTQNTNPGFQPFGFAGGITDEATGFVRFGARDYDPATGRWTASDPIGFAGQDANLYSYAFSDPINYLDSDGFSPCGCESGGSRTSGTAGALTGGGSALEYATHQENLPTRSGQARLGGPNPSSRYGWDRSFHLDAPHGRVSTSHFNAEIGPLSRFNHASIPGWAYRMGSTSALRSMARGAMGAGLALDAYNIATAGPCERGRAVGGAAGGLGGAATGAAIGSTITPGIGTVIGGIIGGYIGHSAGEHVGGQF